MTNRDKALLGAAVAGILGALASGSAMADKKMMKSADVQCMGVNACKGKSSCASAKSGCAGQNGCKGQGWVKTSKDTCEQIGGKSQSMPEKKS